MVTEVPPHESSFFSSSGEIGAPSSNASSDGLKITIADILFCMFAVALSMMSLFQPWGGFEESQAVYVFSGILVAFSASVFFTANRRRRLHDLPLASLEPGHCVALIGAGYLATSALQFLISYLDVRHVGAPIHILAQLSPYASSMAISAFILVKTHFTPRWRAFFIVTFVYGAIHALASTAALNASRSDMSDPLHANALMLSWLAANAWLLSGVFLLVAHWIDVSKNQRRDWLHRSGVILSLALWIAPVFENLFVSRLLWRFLNEISSRL